MNDVERRKKIRKFIVYWENRVIGERKEYQNFREALINLFKILNEKIETRDKYLNENLLSFPYVNGGLFKEIDIEIPKFNTEIIDLIINKMSENFDWSKISSTIFGAIFESTLNPSTRRAGGMHYTFVENIHKVIDPLFLNDIKNELENIKEIKQRNSRNEKLKNLQDKIANLKFLDIKPTRLIQYKNALYLKNVA